MLYQNLVNKGYRVSTFRTVQNKIDEEMLGVACYTSLLLLATQGCWLQSLREVSKLMELISKEDNRTCCALPRLASHLLAA